MAALRRHHDGNVTGPRSQAVIDRQKSLLRLVLQSSVSACAMLAAATASADPISCSGSHPTTCNISSGTYNTQKQAELFGSSGDHDDKNGGAADNLVVTNNGTFNLSSSSSLFFLGGITAIAEGGTGRDEGRGGGSGSVTFTNNGAMTINLTTDAEGLGLLFGIEALSIGGSGDPDNSNNDSSGGVGGDGKTVTVTNNQNLTVTGASGYGFYGILAGSGGGQGGDQNGSAFDNQKGGAGGNGGTVQADNHGTILLGTSSNRMQAPANGGGMVATSVGGDGGTDNGAGGGGGFAAVTNNGSVQIYWNDTKGDETSLFGIGALATGGDGLASEDPSDAGGAGGQGGSTNASSSGEILVDVTNGSKLQGAALAAGSLGGNGGKGPDRENSGGYGGVAGGASAQLNDSGRLTTHGDSVYGILVQSVGGTGGDGGSSGGLLGDAGGAGYGGDAGAVTVVTSANSTITTTGAQSAGVAAQSLGGGGGTGGRFIGILGGSGGDGGRGGNAGKVSLTAAGTVTTEGEHAYGLLAQAIGGGGGTGGIATGFLALGGDGSNGGATDAVTLDNSGTVTTMGYGAHAILAQSTSGGGGAAGVAGGVVAIGGSVPEDGNGQLEASGNRVTVTQTGVVSTAGDAAIGLAAQSIGGGGGAGAGSYGIYAIGGQGWQGGDGGEVDVYLDGGSVDTAGQFSHAVAAQSIGGGGGSGGDVLDFSVGIPSVGIGGSAGAGGFGGSVTVEISNAASLSTRGDHAHGIMAQSIGGGGGSGGDAIGYDGLSVFGLNIGGAGGLAGMNSQIFNGGRPATVTALAPDDKSGGVKVATQGSHAIGVLAQSIGGGGGDGGNATDYNATFELSVAVEVGGTAGVGGFGDAATVNWQNGTVTTGSDLRTLAAAGQPLPITGQASNAYGIVAQSIGGGGGTGGSATVDQIVLAIPGPIPTVNFSSAVGATGGNGGIGGSAGVTIGDSEVVTYGAGAHAVVAQSVGGGGGVGGDGTALGISAAIPTTTKLPAINLSASLGGSGGAAGGGGAVSVTQGTMSTTTIATFGDNANAVVAQSIGGGGGDAGVGSSATFSPGHVTSLSLNLGLGGVGKGGGAGGTAEVTLGPLAQIQTAGSGSRGIVAQSIGGGGGTSQGGTAALYAGPFIGTVKVGRPGGSAGGGRTVTVDNEGAIMTHGGDGDGILAQSIGGSGGLGGTFGADGSLDDPNWVDFILDTKHEVSQFKDLAASYTMTVSVGGKGGTGGSGGEVDIANTGQIHTVSDWADGIVAQSIGGGGGVGGTAVAGGSEQTASVNIGVGGIGGGGGAGSAVNINDVGVISTQGYSAFGLLAQSIGGGGGQGGDGSNKATGTITVGGGIGGDAGGGGDGGEVKLLGGGMVSTAGDGAHAVVLQSIGGGGGVGGTGNSQSALLFQNNAFTIDVGGHGGASGAGKSVIVDLDNEAAPSLDITTTGDRGFGLVAQSIGGGGGIGGGIASAGARDSIKSVSVGGQGGTGNLDGGEVNLSLGDSNITTYGIGSHAIVAQSIGGGGGIGGDASGTPFSFDGPSSTGNIGDGEDVTIVSAGTIATSGDYAFGILAQSIGGGGGFGGDQHGAFAGSNGSTDPNAVSGDVTITAYNVAATGDNSVGIFAQSDSGQDNGTIAIDVTGNIIGGGGEQGAGILVAGGKNNVITVGADGSVSANSGTAIRYDGSSADGSVLTVNNYGHISGNILLKNSDTSCTVTVEGNSPGCAAGTVNNYSDDTLTDASLYQANVMNEGRLIVGASRSTGTLNIAGDFTQSATGEMVAAAHFANGKRDLVEVDQTATLGGVLMLEPLAVLYGAELTMLTAEGGISGRFSEIHSELFTFEQRLTQKEIAIRVAGAHFDRPDFGLSKQQANVAGYLGDLFLTGSIGHAEAFGALEFAARAGLGDYRSALSRLSPGASQAGEAASFELAQGRFQTLLDCSWQRGAYSNGEGCLQLMGSGQQVDLSGGSNAFGFDGDTYSVGVAGQAMLTPDWRVGGMIGYETSDFTGHDGHGSAEGGTVFAGLSATRSFGPLSLSAAGIVSQGNFDTTRAPGLTAGGSLARADHDVTSVAGRLRAAYRYDVGPGYVTPMVDLDMIWTNAGGFTESGAGVLGLTVDDSDEMAFVATPSLEAGRNFDLGDALQLRLYGRAGISFSTLDNYQVNARFAAADPVVGSFDSNVAIPDVVGRISAGAQFVGMNNLGVDLRYDGAFGSGLTSHAASLRLNYKF